MSKKIGVCGLACYKCPKYKSEDCPGCRPNEFCPLPECAQQQGVEFCFDCKQFPCKKNYEGGPVISDLLDHWGDEA